MRTLLKFLSLLFPFLFVVFLFNSCSDARSEKGNKKFDRAWKAYDKANTGLEEEEAVEKMILFSDDYESARLAWKSAREANLPDKEEQAIKKAEEYAVTAKEKGEVEEMWKIKE